MNVLLILFLLLEVMLISSAIYFILKAIQVEKDSYVRTATTLNVFFFGFLLFSPFIMTENFFWLIVISYIAIELVLFIAFKKIPQIEFSNFVELSIKIFEIYIIIFVFFLVENVNSKEELLRALPNFLSVGPISIALFLYGVFGILKILDTAISFHKYFPIINADDSE